MAAVASADVDAAAAVHLVVLQHGLWGTPQNLGALQERLEAALQALAGPERIVMENSGAAARGGAAAGRGNAQRAAAPRAGMHADVRAA
jgi:hypothetical protein